MLSQKRLKELLHYDPDTGLFTRKVSVCNNKYKSGDVAGSISKSGGRRYHQIHIDGLDISNHKLSFLYMTGSLPNDCVDHINGDSFDNRWVNLRKVTLSENNKNKAIDKRNKSGVTGVHWAKKENSWKCQINIDGKRIHLGYFKDIVDAVLERLEAELEYGFHKNHGRVKV